MQTRGGRSSASRSSASRSNPAPSLPLLAAGGAASLVLVGLGSYLVYMGLNPPDTTTTLEDSAALATLASVAL